MYCLYCGDCCKRMSPLTALDPCPHIRKDGNFIFCDNYERRPEECINHTFHGARFCPIGLDVLGLSYPKDTELIRQRIDEGYAKATGTSIIPEFEEWLKSTKHL